VIFEFKVDGTFLATFGRTTVDISSATTSDDVGRAINTAIKAAHSSTFTVTAGALQAGAAPRSPTTASVTRENVPITVSGSYRAGNVGGMSGGTDGCGGACPACAVGE
jgi:hypothetical protein